MSKKFVTEEKLDQAVDAILTGMDGLFKEFGKKINDRFENIDNELTQIKRQISNLKHDTPSRKEFDELKKKVDLHFKN